MCGFNSGQHKPVFSFPLQLLHVGNDLRTVYHRSEQATSRPLFSLFVSDETNINRFALDGVKHVVTSKCIVLGMYYKLGYTCPFDCQTFLHDDVNMGHSRFSSHWCH